MGSTFLEDSVEWIAEDSRAQEEKIFVAVRVRPLNEKELLKNEFSDWECINNTTIVFKNTHNERTLLPLGYTFDRLFDSNCPTRQVYEEAAKMIVLSVLSGMNSTIFAYGQTSSGKTYTMSGITENALVDIYDYINKHSERDYTLKFSAMEIYNETVKDLLYPDSGPLRLLDDPEKGTVVDKLTEVAITDFDHLYELLSFCEAQRQTGETALNEMSSRSHQILRLTVESEARDYTGVANSNTLTATVNFVDLAGSERVSQTSAVGMRLKEGSHINRSLLTLGTVIRKLSKGRNGHIPYRDSKLTRILQSSLGGNARTGIICTMSPAHSHVEQSRNTLLFASCAKQVSTNAQVNVVVSEKELVKRLQRELARLENELRNLTSLCDKGASASALKEKEELIEKMDKEIKDLTYQRDLAQSRLENLLQSGVASQASNLSDASKHKKGLSIDDYKALEGLETIDPHKGGVRSRTRHLRNQSEGLLSCTVEDQFPECGEERLLPSDTSPTKYIDKYFGPDPVKEWEKVPEEISNNLEDDCKEVQCVASDLDEGGMVSNSPSSQPGDLVLRPSHSFSDNDGFIPSGSITPSHSFSGTEGLGPFGSITRCSSYAATPSRDMCSSSLEMPEVFKRVQMEAEDQEDMSNQVEVLANADSACLEDSKHTVMSNCMNEEEKTIVLTEDYTSNPEEACVEDDCTDKQQEACVEDEDDCTDKLQEACVEDDCTDMQQEAVVDDDCTDKHQEADVDDDCIDKHQEVCVEDADEVSEPELVEQIENDLKKEKWKANDSDGTVDVGSAEMQDISPASDWIAEYERQMREIIKLWGDCHTSLAHRTYFFLLFNGEPSDAVYLQVELRRLSYMATKDDPSFSQATRAKALHRERERLSRKMLRKFSSKEREALFKKWGVDVKSKQRRLQVCRKLWTDTTNMEHINESASLVAKLEEFKVSGQAPKEMFGLSFSPRPMHSRGFSWSHGLPSVL